MGWLWLVIGAVAVLVVLVAAGGLASARGGRAKLAQALFARQREHLEAEFLPAAAATGKPRGLRWKACEWGDEVVFARERATGRIVALAGVTIRFEAVEGGDMEGLPAVGNLRSASAVFVFDRGRWQAPGKTVFNLSPSEAVEHFKQQYQRVETG